MAQWTAIALAVAALACASPGGGDVPPAQDAGADIAADAAPADACKVLPTLASLEADYFAKSCAFSSCHSAKGKKGGLDLSVGHAWESLVDVDATKAPGKKRVVPGEPDASFIVQKLEGPAAGEGKLMPEGSTEPFDPECRIHALREWVAAGAPK